MNSLNNVTRECALGHPPTHSNDHRFYVQATESIKLNLLQLNAWDYLLIDPAAKPIRGSYVLVGSAVLPWAGQENIKGRVTKIWRNEGEATNAK